MDAKSEYSAKFLKDRQERGKKLAKLEKRLHRKLDNVRTKMYNVRTKEGAYEKGKKA